MSDGLMGPMQCLPTPVNSSSNLLTLPMTSLGSFVVLAHNSSAFEHSIKWMPFYTTHIHRLSLTLKIVDKLRKYLTHTCGLLYSYSNNYRKLVDHKTIFVTLFSNFWKILWAAHLIGRQHESQWVWGLEVECCRYLVNRLKLHVCWTGFLFSTPRQIWRVKCAWKLYGVSDEMLVAIRDISPQCSNLRFVAISSVP